MDEPGKMPFVSVLMPVFNGERYLRPALDSILTQTLTNFEFIVINDGSRDNSAEILEQYATRDRRIRLIHQENRGLIASLNRGIELAWSEYIARMDADDVSLPSRLEKQHKFLEENPGHALVGTWAHIQVEDSAPDRMHKHPTDSLAAKWALLFNCPFVHSSVMVRRQAVVEAGGYDSGFQQPSPEDYDLWSKIARVHEVANLPEILHIYREVKSSICRTDKQGEMIKHVVAVSARNIAWASGRDPDDGACRNLAAAANRAFHLIGRDFNLRQADRVLRTVSNKLATSQADHALLESHRAERMRGLRKVYLRWCAFRMIETYKKLQKAIGRG